jgi:non-reducing end alpha-L-arabinofuranosidase
MQAWNKPKQKLFLTLMLGSAMAALTPAAAAQSRPQGPCDIYGAAGDPCVAAHSSTRALYAAYNGPLYQIMRQSDGKTLDIGVVPSSASDPGGYANAGAQDVFCANTYCWITILYDQSSKHNDLIQPPRGAFGGPALGGFNNLPLADMAPITVMGHKVYGVFIAPGMGLRLNDAKGTAVDDQAEGQYWVINGRHFNSGCCYDYGNAEIDSRDDDNGTMETTFFGNTMPWYHGNPPGPWVMTDQENNLVGCVNEDKSKLCKNLPNITWRFVTAMAKGEPHHWATLGGDAQKGPLSVMFDGPRIDATYDPMRKQGAILLGNGGDNSHGSQGTFYEGAMTAAGTYPTHATDQLVQANIVAAGYDVPRLNVVPGSATTASPGLQTFTPGSSQTSTVMFTNTTGAPISGLTLSLSVPNGWMAVVAGTKNGATTFAAPVQPGASVSAVFTVKSSSVAFNGDLVGNAAWTADGTAHREMAALKVRNAAAVKINEFRIAEGSVNPTNAFIELYNAGSKVVDISNWTLTEHASQQAIFSDVTIPANTKLAPKGFYLFGLSNSGLAIPAAAGDSVVHVRDVAGMKVGDTISVDTGSAAETRKIVAVGTPAGNSTTLWQPLPDGPVITIAAGATNVPVASTDGFKVGEKIALGYGTTYPAVARDIEKYEVATVTAVGKPGTQAFVAVDAAAGATTLQVTSVANITAGDRIRFDIDSIGHGIDTVAVKAVGSAAKRTSLMAKAGAGATSIEVFGVNGFPTGSKIGFAVGDKLIIGTPANNETVTIMDVAFEGPMIAKLSFKPALANMHIERESVVEPGTGLQLSEPLKFAHAANLPFSARGTGISFAPAAAFAHSSNEPVQPLGTGITLDRPLGAPHAIHAVVQDRVVTTAGYQDKAAPNQWFGGPALTAFGGNMVLRDASGHVVDSLNYGELADPWASEGYQAVSGAEKDGCYVPAPGVFSHNWWESPAVTTDTSAGRRFDGRDTDSNCSDFRTQAATTTLAGLTAGADNLKVGTVANFAPGQTVLIDMGANTETGTIAAVGTAGATAASAAAAQGDTTIYIVNAKGIAEGQSIVIDSGAKAETATVVATAGGRNGFRVTVAAPLKFAHAAGVAVVGTGITLRAPLARAHGVGTQITTARPTPGAPNSYPK